LLGEAVEGIGINYRRDFKGPIQFADHRVCVGTGANSWSQGKYVPARTEFLESGQRLQGEPAISGSRDSLHHDLRAQLSQGVNRCASSDGEGHQSSASSKHCFSA